MDLQEFLFPFIMAILTGSLLILLMFFLRKSKYFAGLFGVGFMVVLYVICILRVSLPIEFPGIQIIIRDDTVYAQIFDFIKNRSFTKSFLSFSPLYIFLGLWIFGSVILLARFIVKTIKFRHKVIIQRNFATQEELDMLEKVKGEVFGKPKRITLRKTDVVQESMTVGFFDKMILIPDIEFDAQELEIILRHECMHIKNRDMWIKLLVEVYCIIFWWNPFAYFLKFDLNNTLETKCDLSVINRFNDIDTRAYAFTVAKFMSDERDKSVPAVNSHFSKSRNNKDAMRRIEAILENPPKKGRQIIAAVVTSVLVLAIVLASYLFIWQPFYGLEVDEKEFELSDNAFVADDTNSYILKKVDGTYLFYFEDYPPMPVTQEEIDEGMYTGYPIYEE
jgi:beta-lactamase regulating signal transducer with metallopeptidase domain